VAIRATPIILMFGMLLFYIGATAEFTSKKIGNSGIFSIGKSRAKYDYVSKTRL
jgi:hypothetical protein